jgi:hypothetical protein
MKLSARLNESESIQRCGWPECRAACCVYGTWVDESERDAILVNADVVGKQLPRNRRDPALWFGEETEGDAYTRKGTVIHTTVVDDPEHYGGSVCIFLREDYKCGLQAAGESLNSDPWSLKPFYCILHPLDIDEKGRVTLDEIQLMVDEPASCVRAAPKEIQLKKLFEEEVGYLEEKSKTSE